MKAQKAAETAVDRDTFWEQKVLVSNLQSELEDSKRKIEQYESQRRSWQETKAEFELTRTKLAHLEEKLSRQDQAQAQLKRRALQDTTNTHSSSGEVTKTLSELGLGKPSAKQAIKALAGSGNNNSMPSTYRGISIGDML